jgi:hypothetical protein
MLALVFGCMPNMSACRRELRNVLNFQIII